MSSPIPNLGNILLCNEIREEIFNHNVLKKLHSLIDYKGGFLCFFKKLYLVHFTQAHQITRE